MDAKGRKTGLVGKAFCGALHTELMEYYRLISTLEGEHHSSSSSIDTLITY